MKVKKINCSSIQTDQIIREAFAKIVNEKLELSNITVTDLVKSAGITRSTFYTHYNSINDLASTLQKETLMDLTNGVDEIHGFDDLCNYIDYVFDYLARNETFYKLVLASNEALMYANRVIDIINEKMISYFSNEEIINIDFYTYGSIVLVIKYFRGLSNYSLSDINVFMKNSLVLLFKKDQENS